jgi:hypothetical protein
MRAAALVSLLLCFAARAQQTDLLPDDYVDPRLTKGRVVFMSRVVAGVAQGSTDQFRPLGQDIGFVYVTNDLHWRGFQLGYTRGEVRGERKEEEPDTSLARFGGGEGASGDAPPPAPGAKNIASLSWYHTASDRLTFRYRVTHVTQFAQRETAADVPALDDRDETRMVQLDAGLRAGTRTHFLTLAWSELTHHGTFDKTRQRTLTASKYLPAIRLGPVILAPRLQLGAVADEGPLVDIINPSLDLSVRVPKLGAYVHAIYSPVFRNGDVQHQVSVYADRTLLMLVFGSPPGPE